MKLREKIMTRVFWVFEGDKFENLSSFEADVAKCAVEYDWIWNPHEKILSEDCVRIKYFGVEGPDRITKNFELRSLSGDGFTSLELLFLIHNNVVEELRDTDHRYFEGLRPIGRKAGITTYDMSVGS